MSVSSRQEGGEGLLTEIDGMARGGHGISFKIVIGHRGIKLSSRIELCLALTRQRGDLTIGSTVRRVVVARNDKYGFTEPRSVEHDCRSDRV